MTHAKKISEQMEKFVSKDGVKESSEVSGECDKKS